MRSAIAAVADPAAADSSTVGKLSHGQRNPDWAAARQSTAPVATAVNAWIPIARPSRSIGSSISGICAIGSLPLLSMPGGVSVFMCGNDYLIRSAGRD